MDTNQCVNDIAPEDITFAEQEHILKQKEKAKKLEEQLAGEKQRLINDIERFQSECNHPEDKIKKIWQKNPDYVFGDSWPGRDAKKILKYFLCTLCGKIIPLKSTNKFKTCQICNGDMEHIETVPGQGVRIFVYECKECRHAEACT